MKLKPRNDKLYAYVNLFQRILHQGIENTALGKFLIHKKRKSNTKIS